MTHPEPHGPQDRKVPIFQIWRVQIDTQTHRIMG